MDLKNNLYKIWNRMSSDVLPAARSSVAIPKKDAARGGWASPRSGIESRRRWPGSIWSPRWNHSSTRIPIVSSGKSAHQALATTRKRCWQTDWVIDLDIRGFFDNLDHELVLRPCGVHRLPVILLYIGCASKPHYSSMMNAGQTRSGTPQVVISPLIANIFLHLAFDTWMLVSIHPFAYANDSAPRWRRKEAVTAN